MTLRAAMNERRPLIDAYHAAVEEENALWDQVQGKGPGQPEYDKALFDRWLEALVKTNQALQALREAFGHPSTPSQPQGLRPAAPERAVGSRFRLLDWFSNRRSAARAPAASVRR